MTVDIMYISGDNDDIDDDTEQNHFIDDDDDEIEIEISVEMLQFDWSMLLSILSMSSFCCYLTPEFVMLLFSYANTISFSLLSFSGPVMVATL